MGCITANILVMAMQHRLMASLTGLGQLSEHLRAQCPELPLRRTACLSHVVSSLQHVPGPGHAADVGCSVAA